MVYYDIIKLMSKYIRENTEYRECEIWFLDKSLSEDSNFKAVSIGSNIFKNHEKYSNFLVLVLYEFTPFIEHIFNDIIMGDRTYSVEFKNEREIKKLFRKRKLKWVLY